MENQQLEADESTESNEPTEVNELETPVGTKESSSLKPEKVKVVSVNIAEVGEKENKKVVLTVKHPDKDEVISISAAKYENTKNQKLEVSGLWYNKDEDDQIRKGSALAIFMEFAEVKVLKELEGKDLSTLLDEKGYLCFKAYS